MKATELRIGNIIGDGRFMFTVIGIKGGIVDGSVYGVLKMKEIEDFYSMETYSLNEFNIEGISLTEEWLLKFGWGYHKSEDCIYYSKSWGKNGIEIIVKDYHYSGFELELGKARYKFIEYVHQLQNLYFALTGNELTII